MKITISILMFFLISVSLNAQPFGGAAPNYRIIRTDYENSNGEKGTTSFRYDTQGRLTSSYWCLLDKSKNSVNNYINNSQGLIISAWRKFSDGLSSCELFTYDSEGNKTSEYFWRSDGVTGYSDYQYNNSRMINSNLKNYKGWINGNLKYKYDSRNRIISGTLENNGKIISNISFEYDNTENLIKESWDFLGKWSQTFSYIYEKTGFPDIGGPYLGQTPPGTEPVIFAPGIVSTGLNTRDIAISNDGTEIYFCISDATATAIHVTKLVNNRWTEPAIAPFSGKGFFDFEPYISPDNTKFFFLSNRPPLGKEAKPGWFYQKIWMMNRTDTGWSEPKMLEETINTENNEFFPSVTEDHVLYFTRSSKNGKAMIYKSRFENGKYSEAEKLPFILPENGILFNAFISPKEDFLITCAQGIDSTNIDQDYYISFRLPNNKWSNLIKFGPEVNFPGDNANSAYVSLDGKYLFFSSSRKNPDRVPITSGTTLRTIINTKSTPGYGSSAIYWVDAKIINDLKPK